MQRYNPKEIEPKWQQQWEQDGIYKATEDPSRPKKYILEYFPYPSGAAMHVGHVRNYTIGDALARHARMSGYNVLHPMGWDGFGLPAENYAIKNGISPRQAIDQNTSRFKKQLMQMGFSYDWSREIDSTDPKYYKWTQWFFLLLHQRGLAYQQESLQWWCPHDKTVLANEQVEAGLCWRCGNPVEKKALKQWFFRITDYADRLAKDLDDVNWTDSIKSMQRNWIGRSKGAEVEFVVPGDGFDPNYTLHGSMENVPGEHATNTYFAAGSPLKQAGEYFELIHAETKRTYALAKITKTAEFNFSEFSKERQDFIQANGDLYEPGTVFTQYDYDIVADVIPVFTTRPDTLYGATFVVAAPEHPLVARVTTDKHRAAVEAYVKEAQAKSDIQRQETDREKTGVFTGAYAINPANGEKIPVWIADYVLYGYGTGAIMAVPAHDERDHEFANKFGLPVTWVVDPEFIREDARDKTDFKQHKKIVAVVENDKGEVLTINWGPKFGGRLTVGGTVEGDESPETTALREITEETGYEDLEVIETGQETFYYKYFAFSKQEAHDTEVSFVHLRLKSDKRRAQNLDDSEQDKFKIEWVPRQVAEREITEPLHRYGIEKFILGACFHGEGRMTNSGEYDGLSSSEAREKIIADLAEKGVGKEVINYKIRDWLISRQRYWGAPIPIIHCPKDGAVPVPEDQLPVELPPIDKYEPSGDGRSPLANVTEWVNTTCPKCGGPAQRETDTMDGFACSSWYFLRFADPHNDQKPFDDDKVKFWLPVDDYIGGAEHAVMHLLYARMWTKVMQDAGLIDFGEPFKTLRNHGMILAPDGQKMSKSKGNTIEPDSLLEQGYGADSIRIMELFIGPWNQMANWSVEGMGGSFRFLQRVWTLVHEYMEADNKNSTVSNELLKLPHRVIKRVEEDMLDLGFNTAIAALMEYVNDLYKIKAKEGYAAKEWQFAIETLLQLLAPFAPHITEELWREGLRKDASIHQSLWPVYDPKYLYQATVTVVVQVNGKVRAQLQAAPDASQEEVAAAAMAEANIKAHTEGKEIKKTIYVPGKLVNFVVE